MYISETKREAVFGTCVPGSAPLTLDPPSCHSPTSQTLINRIKCQMQEMEEKNLITQTLNSKRHEWTSHTGMELKVRFYKAIVWSLLEIHVVRRMWYGNVDTFCILHNKIVKNHVCGTEMVQR